MCVNIDTMKKKSSLLGVVKVSRKSSNIGWKQSKRVKVYEKKERKVVRFSADNDVAFRHVTQDELDQLWYQRHEFQTFKEDCRRTAREYQIALGDVASLDHSKVCLRGLEHQLTRTSILTRRMTISMAIASVLDAQKTTGKQHPERLGEVSKAVSEASIRRAITVAAFDAKLCQL